MNLYQLPMVSLFSVSLSSGSVVKEYYDLFSGCKSDDPLSPDYIPTVFSHVTSPQKRKKEMDLKKFEKRQETKKRRVEEEKRRKAAEGLLGLSSMPEVEEAPIHKPPTPPPPLGHCNSEQCKQYFKALEDECQALRTENIKLKEKHHNVRFDEVSFSQDDEKVRLFTGFPTYPKLMVVFNILNNYLMPHSSLSKFQQYVLVLMKMRLDLSNIFLSYLFDTSSSTVSRIFSHVINVMYVRLVPVLVRWPAREELRLSLPYSFRRSFDKCACIIDCFEIFIERPKDLIARAQTYSSYKSHNTMKYLIGITPQGTVSFISKGWGGRTSDKYVTENSGFLDNILPGDVILADRGFAMEESFGLYLGVLKIPAFTKGKQQLDPIEIENTRGLAAVRIHVERVIGYVRKKYTILSSTISHSLLEHNGETVMPLDKIVHVCCALTNVSESVVPFD